MKENLMCAYLDLLCGAIYTLLIQTTARLDY